MRYQTPSIFEDLETLKKQYALELDLYCYFLNGKVFNKNQNIKMDWTINYPI